MRQKLFKLNEQRAGMVDRMEKIMADAGGRSLTPVEQDRFDDFRSQIGVLDRDIAAERNFLDGGQRQPGETDAAVQIENRGRAEAFGQCPVSGQDGGPEMWLSSDGRLVPALSRQHRLSDYAGGGLPAGKTPRDLRGSLGRIIRAKITGSWKGAEFEREILATAGTSDNSAGGVLVPNPLASFWIDLARAKTVCIQAGAKTVPVSTSDLAIARVIQDPTVQVKGENELFTSSGPTLDRVLLTPRTIGCYMECSRELAEDAPNFGEVVEGCFAKAIAKALDHYVLAGDSTGGEPTGLVYCNHAGLNRIAAHAASLDMLLDAVQMLEEDNEIPATLLWAPKFKNTLWRKLLDGTLVPGVGITDPTSLVSIPQKIVTNQLPTDYAVLGDFTQLMIGLRQDILIETTTEGGERFARHQVGIKATLRGDGTMARPTAFAVMSDMTW